MCQRGSEVIFNIASKEVEIRRQNTDFTNHENGTSSRRNSWKPRLSKIKSRLRDPPEDSQCLKPENCEQSGSSNDRDSFYEDAGEDMPDEFKRAKSSTLTFLQCLSLVLIIIALSCSLWVPILKRHKLWDLPLWKWEILILALICGHLVSGWGIRLIVIVIERNFLLKKRVLYFVYGLRRSVQNSLWLGIVLLMWHFIFDKKVQEKTKSRILPHVTKILLCFLVATLFWLLKTLVVKVLALSFHVNNFFERIQEALFNQFVIETLSGPPMFLERHNNSVKPDDGSVASVHSELRETLLPKKNERIIRKSSTFSRHPSERQDHKIPVDHLHKMNQKNISAWGMRRMVYTIRHGSLTTLDERIINSNAEDESSLQIKTECQAKEAARKIFTRVAKPGSQCIYLEDLMRFMSEDEAKKTLHQFEATTENEGIGISKSALNDWMIHALRERRALALSLNDTKTAVDELHNMVNILVGLIIVITSLSILGIPITHFLIFISSQLLLVVFIFGNTCKTIFEAIVFLFVVHPFDVGDRCEVDGIQMVVEEMNILTTIFLRYDNQKIIYPNSLLATKPIVNYYRSPDTGEAIDFCVHISTPMEKIAAMNERIIRYIESRGDHWHPAPMLIMRNVEELNKIMRLSLWITHRMNHQDTGERLHRKVALVDEMVNIFKELDIQYRILPQDSIIQSLQSCNSDNPTSLWTSFFAANEVMMNPYATAKFC